MKLATWNVNSVRARLERVLGWVERARPDVLCLQEIKCTPEEFPADAFVALGYQVACHGQRGYHGVAIASRLPLADVQRGLGDGGDETQARFLAATVAGMRVLSIYAPNGEAPGTAKYAYKLGWFARLRAHLAPLVTAGVPLAACGDFNVAPTDLDIRDLETWTGRIHCTPAERGALAELVGLGLVDVLRALDPERRVYTWWDYRMLAFPKDNGLRIDLVLATRDVAARARAVEVHRDERKGKQASDHVPVVVELADG